jgi:heme/copper-type cytochrome/quinol oxidase subunit 2
LYLKAARGIIQDVKGIFMSRTSQILFGIGAFVIILAGVVIYAGNHQKAGETTSSSKKSSQTSTSSSQTSSKGSESVSTTVDYHSNGYTATTIKVNQGAHIHLTVNADVEDQVHVHGYDIEKDVKPGQPAVFDFTADKTGRFEFELESRKITLGEIEVNP